MKKLLLFVLIKHWFSICSKKKVSGVVKDKQEHHTMLHILKKGTTNNGASTDLEGTYRIIANATLVFSHWLYII
jgi:hypothetical protein